MLQSPFKHRCRSGNTDRTEGDEDAHENPSCSVITIAQHKENFSYRDKTNKSYRAIFYCPQGFHSRWRKHFILSGISQHLEGLIERHEKWSGRYITNGVSFLKPIKAL